MLAGFPDTDLQDVKYNVSISLSLRHTKHEAVLVKFVLAPVTKWVSHRT